MIIRTQFKKDYAFLELLFLFTIIDVCARPALEAMQQVGTQGGLSLKKKMKDFFYLHIKALAPSFRLTCLAILHIFYTLVYTASSADLLVRLHQVGGCRD
jgi:hypothetical protein